MRIDFSGATLTDVSFHGNSFSRLVMPRAKVRGFLEFRNSTVSDVLDLTGIEIYGTVTMELTGPAGRVWLWDSRVCDGGALQVHQGRTPGVVYLMGSVQIDSGAKVSVTVLDGSRNGTYDLRRSKVAGELAIYGTGSSCEAGAVKFRDLVTLGSGRVGLQAELMAAEGVVRPRPAPSEDLRLARFEVSEWEVVDDD